MAERIDKEFVDGLARGLAVLAAFDVTRPEMTLSEAARAIGSSPAATRRSLFTLAHLGFLRSVGKRYVLTPKVLKLGAAYLRCAHVEDALLPEIGSFVAEFGDASSIGILSGHDVLYIAHRSSQNSLRPIAGTGITYPAFATSMGRVLLGRLSDEALSQYFAASERVALTDVSVTDPVALGQIIREARTRGYATAVDQLAYGVTSLAVPVTLASGEVFAAVNTSGYTGRQTPESLVTQRLEALQACARRIGSVLDQYPTLRHSIQY